MTILKPSVVIRKKIENKNECCGTKNEALSINGEKKWAISVILDQKGRVDNFFLFNNLPTGCMHLISF